MPHASYWCFWPVASLKLWRLKEQFFSLGVGNGKILYISIKIYSWNLTSFHQWDAKATKYLPNVLEWTVLTETFRDITLILPTKSSSCWVEKASKFMDGCFARFSTSKLCRSSPNKWNLGMYFHRVICESNALWAHLWKYPATKTPFFKSSFRSSSLSHNAAL